MRELSYGQGSRGGALWVALLALSLAAGCGDCGDDGDGDTPTPIPTTVEFVAPPSGSIITEDEDANAGEEGVQPLFRLRTAGVKEGEVRLSVSAQGSADPHDSVVLSVNGEELSTDALTLVEGGNEITAELRSVSGALLDQSTLNLTLRLPDPPVPSIRITSPVDGAEIGPEDDRAPGMEGIQIDVLALLTDIPDGSPVVLTLNGAEVQAQDASGANLTFAQVTVPEGEVRLVTTASSPQGDVSDQVDITVAIPAEDCVVAVAPLGAGDCDFTAQDADADPDAPGFQAELTVTTDCEVAVVTVNGADSAPLSVPEGGELTVTIDLEEGDNAVAVTARRRDGSGEVSAPTQMYAVDTVAPTAQITFPEEGRLLTFQNVADEDPSDGLTFEVRGQVSGHDGEVALLVNDAQVATATPGDDGAVTFTVTLTEGGPARLTLRAQDGCENAAAAEVNVTASLDRSALTITAPADGAAFGFADDLEPETTGLQTMFSVAAVDIADGAPVYIECRRLNQSVYLRRSEDVALAEGAASALVTLPDGDYSCRARSDAPEVFSAEVTVSVSLIQEEVFFTQPEEGALLNTPTIAVAARTVNVAQSSPVTLTIGERTWSARARDNAIFIPNVALVEGENVLELQVETEQAPSARRVVVLDTVAPTVRFVSPSADSAEVTAADDESGDLGDGFTVSVSLQVEGAYEGAPVCVSVPYSQERCGVVGADGSAVIAGLELISGEVTLSARAMDAVGNEGRATLSITVTTGLPRLLVTSPEDNTATTMDVINVTVSTDLAPGTAVSLYVNGGEVAVDEQPTDEGGVARFVGVALVPETENTLRAAGQDERGRGWSPLSRITVDTSVPEVLFLSPTDGAVLNAATPDVDGAPGFQISVSTQSPGVVDGQPAALGVQCGGDTTTLSATIRGEQAVFPRVTLTNNASCTLTVRVTNRAGTTGESSATVRVDRTPPTVRFARLRDGEVLNINDDENPEEDGLQRSVRITTGGFEAGQVITLTDDRGDVNLTSAPLTAGQASVVFGPLTLPNRPLTLTARGSDAAGNPASAAVSILVDGSDLVISVESPQSGRTLTYADDLDAVTPGLQVRVVASSVPALQSNPARLCGDRAPMGAAPCESGGYRVLAEGPFQGGLAGIVFDVTLAEGAQSLLVESRLVEDDQLVVSPVVALTVDTIRPEIVSFTLLSDVAPLGVVGIAEDGNPSQPGFLGRFRIQTRGLATGDAVRIFDAANPAVAVAGSPRGLSDTIELDLRLAEEREYQLVANAFDAANNDVAAPPTLTFRVDLTAPTLSLSNLMGGQVLNSADDADAQRAGLQYAINGLSDEVGATVQLWAATGALDPFGAPVDDVPLATAVVSPQGAFDFGADVQLPEGTYTLAARVADGAGNHTDQTARVTVDVTAPTVDIRTPASGASLTQEDPAFLARPGFQVAVTVQSDSRNLPVAIYPVGEDSAVSDAATLDQNGRATLIVTLGRGLTALEARVTDALGNTGRSEPHDLNIDIQGCGIVFTQPATQTVRVAQDDDQDPGNGTTLDFEAVVADVQSCLGRPVALFVGNVEVASQPLTQEGVVRFDDVRFPDASTSVVLAQVGDAQGNLSATSAVTVLVDLIPPTVAFVTPAGPTAAFGRAQDGGGAPGLQTTVAVQVTNASGGVVSVTSSLSGEPVAADVPVTGGVVTMNNLTFPEGEQTVTVTVTDRVGTTAQARATFQVDLTPPSAFTVASEMINPRLGAVELRWIAPGDDGVMGPATRYEVRLSDSPIADMADFMAADLVEAVDAGSPGQEVTFSIEQLPWNPPLDVPSVTWNLAVVAFDEVGNASAVGDNVVVTLGLREARLSATNSAGAFGFKTFPIGDVNNDGFDDLSVFGNPNGGGASYVLYGGDDASVVARDGVAEDVQRLTFEADAFPFFGASAVGLGDINGDGIDDFAVSAFFAGGGNGKVYIYFGVDGGGQINDAPDVVINAPPRAVPAERAYLGISLGVATNFADVAGEGLPDLLIGSYGENAFRGSAYVVLGRTSWTSPITLSNGDDSAQGVIRLEGQYAGGSFGYAAQGLGDVDGDGFSELAVSAYYANAQDGAVSVFFGGPLGDVAGGVLTAAANGTELMKFVDGGQFGGAMSVADLNGDGLVELIAGAYAGNDAVGIFDFADGIPAAAAQFWAAPQPNQLMAEQLALVDVNGDTMPDVVLGGNITQGSTGRVDIYFNDDGGFSGVPPQLRYIRGEKWGNDVTAIGDFNGDGYEDVAVSLSENGSGAVVILY